MHTHFSFMNAVGVFLAVLVIGTLWRLITAHLVVSSNPYAQWAGKAMAFQF